MFSAAWKDGFSQGLAGASQSPWKHNIMIDRQSLCVCGRGACGPCRLHSHHFPRGPWVGSEAQNVSADIHAAGLISQCCSRLPSSTSTHSYRDMEVLCANTQRHTLILLPFSSSSAQSYCASVIPISAVQSCKYSTAFFFLTAQKQFFTQMRFIFHSPTAIFIH